LHKVLEAIEELGYRPSQAARSLRTEATHIIGCRLLPSNYGGTGGVLDRLFHALCDAARSSGYDILTFSASTDDDEIAVYDDLLRRRAVDGFVLANTHHVDARPGWLIGRGARFVAFGRPWGVKRSLHSWVDVDGASGTAEAVRHLARLGHSRIAFLGLAEVSGVGDDRYQGWETAMRAMRLPVKGLVARAEDGIASGRALAEALFDGSRPPTALVCVSDAMAVGAMGAVEDRGGGRATTCQSLASTTARSPRSSDRDCRASVSRSRPSPPSSSPYCSPSCPVPTATCPGSCSPRGSSCARAAAHGRRRLACRQ
jgi:DNA-binding LacI/PurR family transcriptional regulator